MNFLAHCALAYDAAAHHQMDNVYTQGLLAGAVVGDFVKGPVPQDWPEPLQMGTRLHRRIDALSNRNAHVINTANHFPTDLRRYAPIFVDLIVDKWLTEAWDRYYLGPLAKFTQSCYAAIRPHKTLLSANGRRFVDYMEQEDLLANYASEVAMTNGVESVLRRLRTRSALQAPYVMEHTQRVASEAALEFTQLYPAMREAVYAWDGLNI